MSKSKKPRKQYVPTTFEQARDEIFSHILRCGVLEAASEHRKAWFDDTMDYLAERYEGLTDAELGDLRTLGERFSQPVAPRTDTVVTAGVV
jgi:hypothetical protein